MSFVDNSCAAPRVAGTFSLAPGDDCSGLAWRDPRGPSCDQDGPVASPTVPPMMIAVKSIFLFMRFLSFIGLGCVQTNRPQWPCQVMPLKNVCVMRSFE